MNNRSDDDSDAFLYGTIPEIFKEKVLPYGITTVKDLCAPRHFIYKLRDEIRKGKITEPELFAVGPNFTAPDGHPANTALIVSFETSRNDDRKKKGRMRPFFFEFMPVTLPIRCPLCSLVQNLT